ncbi:MAG TPA: peptide deformylase [Candidatus Paceibacterota bacterium]|jgi:peptide deformylase|nr:peptide deformylase [Candidatus Paceibacterota bacterium]HRS47743.1 peptide deformylase [Candidatus Paceibacterota bacterium]
MDYKIIIGKDSRILRKKAQDVKEVNKEIRSLIEEMRRIMKENDGIGLAAPQIGVDLNLFVAEIDYDKNKKGKFYALINPKIVSKSEATEIVEEGCLSLPKEFGEVERSKRVTVVGLNEFGRKVKIKAEGLLARVFQHEIDHLNGALFIDKASKIRKEK